MGKEVTGKGRSKPADEKKGFESIELILKRWLKANRAPRQLDRETIVKRWTEVVGKSIAARTRPLDIQNGILLVEVNSAPLLQELSTYYRQDLLESLKGIDGLGVLQDIRFRSGSF